MIDKACLDKIVTDLVIMNDELCIHGATFDGHLVTPAFAVPIYSWQINSDGKTYRASIRCPMCRTEYMEASKRLSKELCKMHDALPKGEDDGKDLG